MVSLKELDEKLRSVQEQTEEEQEDLREEQRKLFEFEETFLRDTIVEGNVLTGWGDTKNAPIRFRNALLRRRKRERNGDGNGGATPPNGAQIELSAEEQLKLDRHRLASYSSVTSPAEVIYTTLAKRKLPMAPSHKKVKKPSSVSSGSGSTTTSPRPRLSTDSSKSGAKKK